MVRNLIVLASLVFSLTAYADVKDLREEINQNLNNSVKDLKELYNETSELLNDSKAESETLRKQAEILSGRSQESEINPKVLKHGSVEMVSQDCDSKKEVLSWDGNKWLCVPVKFSKECQAAAPDEYRYKDKDGNHICSKSAKGVSIKYYWSFTGYGSQCLNASTGHAKNYGCFYKNKKGHAVQVKDSLCSASLVKPAVAKKVCTANWSIGDWGQCQYRIIMVRDTKAGEKGAGRYEPRKYYYSKQVLTCPTGYTCGAKPNTAERPCRYECYRENSKGRCMSGGWVVGVKECVRENSKGRCTAWVER